MVPFSSDVTKAASARSVGVSALGQPSTARYSRRRSSTIGGVQAAQHRELGRLAQAGGLPVVRGPELAFALGPGDGPDPHHGSHPATPVEEARMPGVIGHLPNPTVEEAVALAQASEAAGATWLGLADAFWWRDGWMLLAAAARATTVLRLGLAMTNPYLRHPFHTVAALATLQEIAGDRVFLGVSAGGSELTLAAGVDRRDAPERSRRLIDLVRAVAEGGPLDGASGRRLDLPLAPVSILVGAGRDGMLGVAGSHADQALVWAAATSDLDRVAGVIRRAGAGRNDGGPELVWAPLVELAEDRGAPVDGVAVYAVLNAAPGTAARWGLGLSEIERIRAALVAGDRARARQLLPENVLEDLILRGEAAEPASAAERARGIGASSVAVPCFSVPTVSARVAWGAAVEAALERA